MSLPGCGVDVWGSDGGRMLRDETPGMRRVDISTVHAREAT